MGIPTQEEIQEHNRRALRLKAVLYPGLFLLCLGLISLSTWVQGKLPKDGLWPAISALLGLLLPFLGLVLVALALIGYTRLRKAEKSGPTM